MVSMIVGFVVVVFWETFMDFTGMYSLLLGFTLAFIAPWLSRFSRCFRPQKVVNEFDAAQSYEDPPRRPSEPLKGPSRAHLDFLHSSITPTPKVQHRPSHRVIMDRIHDYDTVESVCEDELTLKGSRFIGIIMPCPDEFSIQANITEVMGKYRDATHYCWAAVYDGLARRERSSDNGEPSGTAGKPILSNLKSSGLSDVMCVVVRYFGGTLLGTGGLIHAYGEISKLALQGVRRRTRVACAVYRFTLNYSYYSQFENRMKDIMARRPECEYSDRVDVVAYIPSGREEEFERRITDLTERHIKLWRMDDEYLDRLPRNVMKPPGWIQNDWQHGSG